MVRGVTEWSLGGCSLWWLTRGAGLSLFPAQWGAGPLGSPAQVVRANEQQRQNMRDVPSCRAPEMGLISTQRTLPSSNLELGTPPTTMLSWCSRPCSVHVSSAPHLDLGKKVSIPQDLMMEELSLKTNRGSRLYQERQKRMQRFVLEHPSGYRGVSCPVAKNTHS